MLEEGVAFIILRKYTIISQHYDGCGYYQLDETKIVITL